MRIVITLLFINIAWAQVDELYLVAGYANRTRYAYICEDMYNAFKNNPSLSTTILANPSTRGEKDYDLTTAKERIFTSEEMEDLWKFNTSFINLNSAHQIEESFRTDKARSEERQPLLFITNHGGAPRDDDRRIRRDIDSGDAPQEDYSTQERMSATISLEDYHESFTTRELEKMIRKKFDQNDTIRLIGIQCYSGALHDLSFRNDNICSATSTDWLTVTTSSSSEGTNLYAEGIAQEKARSKKQFDLNNDGQTSLQEAHIAGLANDTLNWGRGQLSSMAYIDMILEESAYAENISREYYNPADDPMIKSVQYSDCIACTDHKMLPYSLSTFVSDIEAIRDKLSQGLYVPEIHDLTIDELIALPTQLRTPYENLLKSGRFKGAQNLVRISINQKYKKRDELEQKINDLNTVINSGMPYEDQQYYRDQIREVEKALEKNRNGIEKLITPLRGITNYLLHLKKVARFLGNATRKQKLKYLQLLNCEMEPL